MLNKDSCIKFVHMAASVREAYANDSTAQLIEN